MQSATSPLDATKSNTPHLYLKAGEIMSTSATEVTEVQILCEATDQKFRKKRYIFSPPDRTEALILNVR